MRSLQRITMFRSGKFPKKISRYIDSLEKKVEAEVLLNTVTYVDGKTMKKEIRVASMETVGVTEIQDSSKITNLLARFVTVNPNDDKVLENGLIVTEIILDQARPEKPILKLGFTVDFHKMPEWGILEFQEVPKY